MSDKWAIQTINEDENQAFLIINASELSSCKYMLFHPKNNKVIIADVIIIAKGMPKLWDSSKYILCEWVALTIDLGITRASFFVKCKYEKVEGPQPNIGLKLILDKADNHISTLGIAKKLNSKSFSIALLTMK